MRAIPTEDFSTLVGSIYDCALDPGLWPGVLAALSRELRCRTSTLALQEMPSGRALLSVNHGVAGDDLEQMMAMGEAVPESWGGIEAFLGLPLEVPLIQTRFNPLMSESRFAREWGVPRGFIDMLAIGFTRDRESLSSIGFGPTATRDRSATRRSPWPASSSPISSGRS